MNCANRQENSLLDDATLMEQALEHVAEALGDIVPLILQEFYRQEPDTEEIFKYYGFEQHQRMAQSMVDEVLHCIMSWPSDRGEVMTVIRETVPHHRSLNIPDHTLVSLLDVTLGVLLSGIPAAEQEERAAVTRIGSQLREEIAKA